jgi:chorismate mutase
VNEKPLAMPDDRFSSAALHAFALVAALRTALGVSHGIAARRAGEDPSEDEPEAPVRAYLGAAVGRMGHLLVGLRLRVAVGAPAAEHAALVQAFEDRLALADLSEELRVGHQKLLSLYPAVDAALVEAVRERQREVLLAAEGDDLDAELVPLLERLAGDLVVLRLTLVEQP